MVRIHEVIVVEGVYDKNALLQVVDASVIDIGGFGLFNDKALQALLRRLADTRGVIVMTDSDGAGFLLRSRLRGMLPPDRVRHAYVPDIRGKERRKSRAGKEGKLGVEGMPPEILLDALRKAGATTSEATRGGELPGPADFYIWGLSGAAGSAERREKLKQRLGLPERLSAKALFQVLSALYSREELESMLSGEL